MKIELSQKLKDLDGAAVEGTVGKFLANALIAVEKPADATRNYVLATEYYKNKDRDIDAEELQYIRAELEKAPVTTFIKGQLGYILNQIDKPEDKE